LYSFLAILSPLVIRHYTSILHVHFNKFCYKKREISNLIVEFCTHFHVLVEWPDDGSLSEPKLVATYDYKAKCDCDIIIYTWYTEILGEKNLSE